jgi:hypothetical protein
MTASLIVVVGPITTTSRLEKKLSQYSRISTRIIHTPDELGNGGCSYSIRTKGENLPIVLEIAKKYNVKIKGYYLAEAVDGKEEYHVIS